MRAVTFDGAVFHARNVREGQSGRFWWREDMGLIDQVRHAKKQREANLDLFEKLGGKLPKGSHS